MSKRRARKERGGDGSRQRSRVRLDGLLHHHGLLDGRLAQTSAKTVTDGGEIDGFPKVGCLSGQTQMNTFSRREARHVVVRKNSGAYVEAWFHEIGEALLCRAPCTLQVQFHGIGERGTPGCVVPAEISFRRLL